GDHAFTQPERWLLDAAERLAAAGLEHDAVVELTRLGWKLAQVEIDALVADVAAGGVPAEALISQEHRRRAIAEFISSVRQARLRDGRE
ncbi:MAG: hypothetical protein ACI9OJ_003825, partial [Myxococcota bacterium]